MNNGLRQDIIDILKSDARCSLELIAKQAGCTEEEAAAEIAALEADNVILGYHAMINPDLMDNEKVSAIIEVNVSPQREQGFDAIAERIYRFDEVDTVLLISGGFDLLVMVEGKTMREVAFFVAEKLSTIENVTATATHFVLKHYKQDGVIISAEPEDDRLAVVP